MRTAGHSPSPHGTSPRRDLATANGIVGVGWLLVACMLTCWIPSFASARSFELVLPEPPPSFLERERPEYKGADAGAWVAQRATEVARAPHEAALPIRRGAIVEVHLAVNAGLEHASRYSADGVFLEQRGRLLLPSSFPLRARFGHRPRSRPGVVLPHPGWTFASPAGSPIQAPARGVILHAAFVDGLGGTVLIAHDRHHLSLITHLISIDVQAGDVVLPGQRLGGGGALSAWGTEDTYFEIRVDGIPVDPAPWMERQPQGLDRSSPQSAR